MNGFLLERLRKNRDPIILAEIGAYLHLIGRFSKDFIDAQAEDSSAHDKGFDYKGICKRENRWFFEDTDLDSLLRENLSKRFTFKKIKEEGKLRNKPNDFCNFISSHTNHSDDRGLLALLADAHGIVSAIDKGLAGRGKTGKQRKGYTYKATAFGYEEEIELLEKPDLKREFFKHLKSQLEKIVSDEFDDKSYERYRNFVNLIAKYYSKTIGETRRPINEVTLYDYAYTIACLMKSSLAKIILDGKWHGSGGKLNWRILRINVDVIGMLSKGLKVGDILGTKELLEGKETKGGVYGKIKQIVEYDYPLGNEIYRDSTGIYFSCPDVEDINDFKKEIKKKFNEEFKAEKLDFSLSVGVSDASRSMVILARERKKALEEIIFHHKGDMKRFIDAFEESRDYGKDICPVCQIRMKDGKRERCEVCEEKYIKRAERWIESPKQTIWVDEVADHNDRVAMVVGQFDLTSWLSGEALDTYIMQTFEDWKSENKDLCKSLSMNSLEDLKNQFEGMLKSPECLSSAQKELCYSFARSKTDNFVTDFWYPIAERDATGTALRVVNSSKKVEWLAKLLFVKHPSFARVGRIWETTYEFISKIVGDLNNHDFGEGTERSNIRRSRICFKLKTAEKPSKGLAYELSVKDHLMDVVCVDPGLGKFVCVDNLQLLPMKFGKNLDEIVTELGGKTGTLKVDNRKIEEVQVLQCEIAEEKFQDYLPWVSIFDFPDEFMSLVPAWDVQKILENIISEYKIQFSKVRDRLPFHLGVVFFHRKTPLFTVMDAGKRMISCFRTYSKNCEAEMTDDFKKEFQLAFRVDSKDLVSLHNKEFKWCVSYSTGDPQVEDKWHPYIRVAGGTHVSHRKLRIIVPKGVEGGDEISRCIHVTELRKHDKILVKPSLFSFIFLESNAMRFEAGREILTVDDFEEILAIWKTLQNLAQKKELTQTKLRNVEALLHSKLEDWGESEDFELLVESTLKKDFGLKKDREKFELLKKSIFNGLFFKTIEWNTRILKKKLGA